MIDVSVCNCQAGVTGVVVHYKAHSSLFILPSSYLLDCFGLACFGMSLLYIYLFLHNHVSCRREREKLTKNIALITLRTGCHFSNALTPKRL